MKGALYYQLQELQFELYVARQTKNTAKEKELEKKIKELEKELKGE